MIDADGSGLTTWQQLFVQRACVKFPAKIMQALDDPDSFAAPEKVSELVSLVQGALVVSAELEATKLTKLIQLSFDTLLIVGAEPGFGEYQEFFDSSLTLIEILKERGAPISRLLLSAARFQAGLANGARLRRRLIERAVATSTTPDELLPALLTLAKFLIDISDYPGSRRVLSRCKSVLSDGKHPEFESDLEATTALSYYYSEPDIARRHFVEAIRLGRDYMNEPETRQPAANATHFLGRLAADNREYRPAIELFTEAEKLSDDYLTGHGFYHQRIAEILVDNGMPEETYYHLKQGSETFKRIGQVSNGLALLEGVWARWYLREGDQVNAEKALHAAIGRSRKDTVPRAELVLLVQLIRLKLQQRHAIDVLRLVCRAGWLYLRVEVSSDPRRLFRQAWTAFRTARRILAVPQSGTTGSTGITPISCPCGADHHSSGVS
jgi:hypothetical protein